MWFPVLRWTPRQFRLQCLANQFPERCVTKNRAGGDLNVPKSGPHRTVHDLLDKLNWEHGSTVCLPVEYHGNSARIDCDQRVLAVLVGTPDPHGLLTTASMYSFET